MNESYKNKYLKYKSKYLKLKNQLGGADPSQPVTLNHENKNYKCEQLTLRETYEKYTGNSTKLEGIKENNTINITGNYKPEANYNKYYYCMNKEEIKKRLINMNNDFSLNTLKRKNIDIEDEDARLKEIPELGWQYMTAEEIVKYKIYCGPNGSYGKTKGSIILQSLDPSYKDYLFLQVAGENINPCAPRNHEYSVFIFKKNLDEFDDRFLSMISRSTFLPITNKSVQIGKFKRLINDAEKRKIIEKIKQHENWKKAASERNEQDVKIYHQLEINTLRNLLRSANKEEEKKIWSEIIGKSKDKAVDTIKTNPPFGNYIIRIAGPDEAVTDDYRWNRVNITIDENDKVKNIDIG